MGRRVCSGCFVFFRASRLLVSGLLRFSCSFTFLILLARVMICLSLVV